MKPLNKQMPTGTDCAGRLVEYTRIYHADANTAHDKAMNEQAELSASGANTGAAKSALTRQHKRSEQYNDSSKRQSASETSK